MRGSAQSSQYVDITGARYGSAGIHIAEEQEIAVMIAPVRNAPSLS